MEENSPKITGNMVSSLDGDIAAKNGDITWLKSEDHFDMMQCFLRRKSMTFSEKLIDMPCY